MLITVLCLFWLIHFASCQTEQPEPLELPDCGLTTWVNPAPPVHDNSSQMRFAAAAPILGGREATTNEVPWMARLDITMYHDPFTVIISSCSGVILNHHWILTAAHCLEHRIGDEYIQIDPIRYPMTAYLGSVYLESNQRNVYLEPNVSISAVFIYPEFATDTFIDIGLVRTAKSMQMLHDENKNQFLVNTICLPNVDIDFRRNYSVAGFGNNGSTWNQRLMMLTNVPVTTNSQCRSLVNNYRNNLPRPLTNVISWSEQFFCSIITNNHSACEGDSGGPLFGPGQDGKFYLLGVTQGAFQIALEGDNDPNSVERNKYPCGFINYYTFVHRHVNWIRTTMESNMVTGLSTFAKTTVIVFVILLVVIAAYLLFERFYPVLAKQDEERQRLLEQEEGVGRRKKSEEPRESFEMGPMSGNDSPSVRSASGSGSLERVVVEPRQSHTPPSVLSRLRDRSRQKPSPKDFS